LAAAAQVAPAHAQVTAVPLLDLDRYMGQWFEIARTPNSHELDCASDVVSTYERLSESAVDVASACRHADGQEEHRDVIARVRDPVSKAKLELRYAPRALGWIPFVWDDYWVLNIAPTYAYALVGEPGRESLWILARTPKLDDATYAELVAAAAAQGFDTGKLSRTPQSGRPYAPPEPSP
jgi:apolipoprotein D and lipocalin family protein